MLLQHCMLEGQCCSVAGVWGAHPAAQWLGEAFVGLEHTRLQMGALLSGLMVVVFGPRHPSLSQLPSAFIVLFQGVIMGTLQ